jgi:prepilin peptidase CpaA
MQPNIWWPTLILLAVATAADIRNRRIPNWLVLPFLVAGMVVSAIGHGLPGVGQSAGGIALAAAVMGVLCWFGGMGMGDLKLCAAVGAWIGPAQLIVAMVVMGIAGGFMALIWAARHGSVSQSLDGASDIIHGPCRSGLGPHASLVLGNPSARTMPYAPAIAIGTVFSFFAR